MRLKGVARGLSISGQGAVNWCFLDENGNLRAIPHRAFLVKKVPVCLLSTSSVLQTLRQAGSNETIELTSTYARLSGDPSDANLGPVVARINEEHNLPASIACRTSDVEAAPIELNACVAEARNQNLSQAKKELLRWHFKLGHLNF